MYEHIDIFFFRQLSNIESYYLTIFNRFYNNNNLDA